MRACVEEGGGRQRTGMQVHSACFGADSRSAQSWKWRRPGSSVRPSYGCNPKHTHTQLCTARGSHATYDFCTSSTNAWHAFVSAMTFFIASSYKKQRVFTLSLSLSLLPPCSCSFLPLSHLVRREPRIGFQPAQHVFSGLRHRSAAEATGG